MLIDALILLATGALAGFLAGLLGIGGGLVIVPALLVLLAGRMPEYAMHVAVGTSLASIVLTSIASVRAHHGRGAVDWPVMARLTPGLVLGSALAAAIAAALSSLALTAIFGVFCLLVSLQMMRGSGTADGSGPGPGAPELVGAGTVIGTVSALVGIGGGSLTVPYLTWRGVAIHRAVGTSAACGLPIAVAGALGFVVTGWAIAGRPAPSVGFVWLPALLAIVVTSVPFAPLGARAAHALPTATLRRVFAGFLAFMGLNLLWQAFG
ncbi:MAG: sulfite exporter TauE/SafE family protein [Pseudomonadota bacterium]